MPRFSSSRNADHNSRKLGESATVPVLAAKIPISFCIGGIIVLTISAQLCAEAAQLEVNGSVEQRPSLMNWPSVCKVSCRS
jgi:hypothetical protein